MSLSMHHLNLGASIYVPATRDDILAIALRAKLKDARSVIFCTEDSVSEQDLPRALTNLQATLARTTRQPGRMLFIRPRNVEVLGTLLAMPNIESIDGFVLPKLTAGNLGQYRQALQTAPRHSNGHFWLMPTLETKEVFDNGEMRRLHDALMHSEVRDSVLSLRIGGNDLLNILGVRRSRYRTLYESPLATTISNLVTVFKPSGFNLTSPVCEFLYDHEVLERELALDAEFGLFGKTAIHPDQIAIIEHSYRPSEQDVQAADALLCEGAPAVFGMHGAMCEVATHSGWARQVQARAKLYGVYGRAPSQPLR